MKISLLLVDDHPVVREGIRSYFSSSKKIEVIGEASTGPEAIELAGQLLPNIVLMDINMPGLNGLDATRILKEKTPSVKVIILTVHDSKEYISQMVKVGAHGYVLKDASPLQLLEAIESVHSGRKFFTPQIADAILDLLNGKTAPVQSDVSSLSDREKEVLAWVARGASNKEIAVKMDITANSVKTYRRRIMGKLNIHHTAGLTKFALEHHITPPEN